jgi:hypothetical protein
MVDQNRRMDSLTVTEGRVLKGCGDIPLQGTMPAVTGRLPGGYLAPIGSADGQLSV